MQLHLGKIIITQYQKFIASRQSKAEEALDRRNMSSLLSHAPSLTNEEKRMIDSKWSSIIKNPAKGYEFFRGIKALNGNVDANYLPSSYFFPLIEGILNPKAWKYMLAHKSMTELIYDCGVKHPQTVLRSYGGILMDCKYNILSVEKAFEVLKDYNAPLIFKPATDSMQGAGIKLIEPADLPAFSEEILNGGTYKTDFVLQLPVKQSSETSPFNPSSLNCMRITTLNLNGQVSVCTRALKCGSVGAVVDNIGSGKRGVIVGISNDGVLNDFGYYGNGETTDSHNGVKFSGYKINHFQRVVEAALHLHQINDKCKIIGWDIALDSDNCPVLIEGNVVYPGISFEQLCSGPIFGERTDEVIAFISKRLHTA